MEQAEIIKCTHGIAKSSLANDDEKIKITGTNGRNDKNVSDNFEETLIINQLKCTLRSMHFMHFRKCNAMQCSVVRAVCLHVQVPSVFI